LAMLRAAGQLVVNGRIISGGSTITMQLARLLEPREERSFAAKFRQMLRAVQIERRLTKAEILDAYLTLAPYGGNLEGVRAASLSWFGKEPVRLSLAEAALLVALPQSPEMRRPDRYPQRALEARTRVLQRMAEAGVIAASEAKRVGDVRIPHIRMAMPQLAPHLAQAAIDRDPLSQRIATRLDAGLQERLERVASEAARRIGAKVSVAILAAEADSGDIVASVGSSGLLDRDRAGWIDMTQALRSPGSTLKPFIYGLAIEDGLVLPETVISDRPANFSGYRPANFDMSYQGDVSVREALQHSLNVPAVRLLEASGPVRLVGRMRRAGVTPVLPEGEKPGLAIALGGVGLRLQDLVQLYANLLVPGSVPVSLGDGVRTQPARLGGQRMLNPVAGWHVTDMLSGIGEPAGSRPLPIAYKTGTSYGYRDAWSVGYDGRHVIGVWAGRADNGPVPGISGAVTAAPVLFEAFEKSGFGFEPFARAPAGAVRLTRDELPAALRRFEREPGEDILPGMRDRDRLRIAFPADGSELEVPGSPGEGYRPVVVKLSGGRPPFRLLADGKPLESVSRRRQMEWQPAGAGSVRLTVLDAEGRAQSISVQVR
ncbi:MAG: penicillin-binding protein 1C, partial [Nitratireductor sp.]|nr:penicillin-binding protein 1C [Nitratireductor sp.]